MIEKIHAVVADYVRYLDTERKTCNLISDQQATIILLSDRQSTPKRNSGAPQQRFMDLFRLYYKLHHVCRCRIVKYSKELGTNIFTTWSRRSSDIEKYTSNIQNYEEVIQTKPSLLEDYYIKEHSKKQRRVVEVIGLFELIKGFMGPSRYSVFFCRTV